MAGGPKKPSTPKFTSYSVPAFWEYFNITHIFNGLAQELFDPSRSMSPVMSPTENHR